MFTLCAKEKVGKWSRYGVAAKFNWPAKSFKGSLILEMGEPDTYFHPIQFEKFQRDLCVLKWLCNRLLNAVQTVQPNVPVNYESQRVK